MVARAAEPMHVCGSRCIGSCGRSGSPPRLLRVGDVVTYAIELAVGLGCVIGSVPALGHPRLRWFGVVLLVAGIAAVVHALVELLG